MIKIFTFYIIIQAILIIVCLAQKCETITDQTQCNSLDLCEFDYWKPSLCQYRCASFITEIPCNDSLNCVWDSNSTSCQIKKCIQTTNKAECELIVACIWQDKCLDASCVTLNATDSGKCPTNYCIWSSKRNLCYDKKCSDYSSKYDCSQISFCEWSKYKCIPFSNSNETTSL